MAKMTKAQRSAAAKKAWRARRRKGTTTPAKKRNYSMSAKKRTVRRKPRRKSRSVGQMNVMAKGINVATGMAGAGVYLASNLIYKPTGMIGKVAKTIIGSVALNFVSGSAAAGFAGAGTIDIASTLGVSLSARGKGRARKLRACGYDQNKNVVLKDNKGNVWGLNSATGKYQPIPSQGSPYSNAYNSNLYPFS